MSKRITATVEKYLKGIYKLQERNGFAKTSDLIKMFNVSPGTITNTIKRLKIEGLVILSIIFYFLFPPFSFNFNQTFIWEGFYSKNDLEREKPDLIVDSLCETGKILGYIFDEEKNNT